jgi:hypothetical protein
MLPVAAMAKAAAIVVAGGAVFYARRNKPNPFPDEVDDGTSGIDLEALEAAERAASETIDEQRRRLDPAMQLWSRIPTTSMTQTELETFLDSLAAENIQVAILYDAALAPKAGRYMRQIGYYEIYVHEKDRARLEEFENRS